MKRKIKFSTINTAASELRITLDNGYTIIAKNKDDFNDLLTYGIVFDEYDCKDYNDISISGEKDHSPTFNESSNNVWVEHAKSYIDHKHFGSQEYVDKVDKDGMMEVHVKISKDEWYATDSSWYSNFDISKITSLMEKPTVWLSLAFNNKKTDSDISFLNRIISNKKGLLDLSDVEMADDLTDISNFSKLLDDNNNSNLTDKDLKLSQRITKVPTFNYNVITNAKDAFKDMSLLDNYSSINFPIATDVSGLLKDCQNLSNVSSINISKATNASYMLFGTAIRTFGDLSLDLVENVEGMFSDINVLETVGKVTLPSVTNAKYMFANCRNLFNHIGDIYMPNAETAFGMFQNDFALTTLGNLNVGGAYDIFAVDEGQNICSVTSIGNITADCLVEFHGLNLISIGNIDMYIDRFSYYDGNLETLQSIGNISAHGLTYEYFVDCPNLQSVGTIYRRETEGSISLLRPDLETDELQPLFSNCTSLSHISFVNNINNRAVYGIPDTCEVITDDFYNYPSTNHGTPVSAIDKLDEYNSTVRIIDGVSHFQYNFDTKLVSIFNHFVINQDSVSLGEPFIEDGHGGTTATIAALEDKDINNDISKINPYGNPQGTGKYQINVVFNGKKENDTATVIVDFPYTYTAMANGVEVSCVSTFKMKFNLTFGVSETIEYSIVEVDDDGNEIN